VHAAPYGGSSEAVNKVSAYLKEHGIFHYNNGHIFFTNPPLTINEAQIKETFAVIDEALKIADSYTTAN
jgi:taurine--2-oxoglutarate transaminase